MKKILLTIMLILPFTLILAPAVFAAERSDYVFDETGTLTTGQIEDLSAKASALSEKHKCGIYIWIVDLVPKEYAEKANGDLNIDGLEAYADAFYKEYALGWGDDKNGMVLLLEAGDEPGKRDYLINTHGSCTDIFTNSKRETLLDDYIVPLFKSAFNNRNFYKVADTFLDKVENEFALGFAVNLGLKLIVVILVPMLIALIVCSGWKRKMKTAKIARTADNYIPANGFNLTGKSDTFLYRTTTRIKIEQDSSSSGGGSSSSSSGRSSGGRV
jgi:uncharacterized protein